MRMYQKLGTFRFGDRLVDLFVLPNQTGGEFYFVPDEKNMSRIKIGLDYHSWYACLSTLLHETIEFALCCLELRYAHSGKFNGDSGDFLFVFDHAHFGRAMSISAEFLAEALPQVASAYHKNKKQVKNKKQKGKK